MTRQITYRPATTADIIKLSILYKQVYIHTYGREGVSDEFANFIIKQFAPERLQHIIDTQPGSIIVAVYKNNLVGVAEVELDKKCPTGNMIAPELNKLYILDWFCGMGVGTHLLAHAETFVRSTGDDKMWLWVLESNDRAIAFYEKYGYEHIGDASFQMEVNTYHNKVMLKHLV